jgi:catalase-peroxidase
MSHFVETAWASASTFRKTDKRGGANGARIRLQPQNTWEINNKPSILNVISFLESIKDSFNASLADLIVLAGCAAIEKITGDQVEVPFIAGRGDATQEQTDIESFAVLEPKFDGFRNYVQEGIPTPEEVLLVEKANLLGLTPVEMVLLLSGMRMLSNEKLDNSYLVDLLSYINADQANGVPRVDLIIASNSELRAIAEVYASDDAKDKYIKDFISAWDKVMMLDRFDVKKG